MKPIAADVTGRRGRICQVLALVLALFVLEQNVEYIATQLNLHPYAGTIRQGARAKREGAGRFRVVSLKPDAPLARQGVKVGAVIVADRPLDFRPITSRDPIGAEVTQAGKTVRMRLVPAPSWAPIDWRAVVSAALLTSCLGYAVVLVLASRGRPAPLMLGAALTGYSEVFYSAQPLASGALAVPIDVIANLVAVLTFVLFLLFALHLQEDATGRKSPGLRLVVGLAALVLFASFAAATWYRDTGMTIPVLGDGGDLLVYAPQFGFALALAIVADALRRSRAERRRRYGILLLAFALLVAGQSLAWVGSFLPQTSTTYAMMLLGTVLGTVLAPILFTYAILRQKVMDLGFAINRTLVYGMVSVVLLVAFGLLEWAVEHFVPIEGREKNAFIDAGLALCVFLTFHRVRDATEHVIEALFFRRWHRQEAELKRFLREAPFITRPEALARSAVEAIERFAGAGAAIYLRGEDSDLRRIEGDLGGPAVIDADHPALVAVRTDPRPLELDAGSGLSAGLIAPMLNRKDVTGAVLIGAKPEGGVWRPDELALIGQAAVQIGQDLNVLEVERLDRLAAELKKENDLLRTLRLQPT